MTPKVRDYACPDHGVFEATIDWESNDIFDHPCPQCGRRCDLDRYRPEHGGPPAVHGDVRQPYYNPEKDIWVTRKQDLRDYHKRTGTVPLSDRDLVNAVDAVAVRDHQAKDEQKRFDRAVAAGRGPAHSSGDMPR